MTADQEAAFVRALCDLATAEPREITNADVRALVDMSESTVCRWLAALCSGRVQAPGVFLVRVGRGRYCLTRGPGVTRSVTGLAASTGAPTREGMPKDGDQQVWTCSRSTSVMPQIAPPLKFRKEGGTPKKDARRVTKLAGQPVPAADPRSRRTVANRHNHHHKI